MSRPHDLNIKARTPEFGLAGTLREHRYWLGDDPVLTHFFNALQSTFPEGERFFIDAARALRDRLGDRVPEQLARDLRAFIHQEAWHGKAHDSWNEALAAAGYERMEEFGAEMRRLRIWAGENIAPMMRLAMTAGAEHMTASLARLLLYRREDLVEQAVRPVRDLLVWHALEEVEHKAVCYDLFREAGGSYRLRVVGLVIALIDTFRLVRQRHRYLLKKDGLWNLRTRLRSWRLIWGPRGIVGQLMPELMRYLRPGFHPWETDERSAFMEKYGDLVPAA